MSSTQEQMIAYLSEHFPVGTEIPLPVEVVEYLGMRNDALSNAIARGQQATHNHSGWMEFALQMPDVVDQFAWALFYEHIPVTDDKPRACYPMLLLTMSKDPARPYVKVHGIHEDAIENGVGAAHALAWELDLDATELKPMDSVVGKIHHALVKAGALSAPSLDGGFDLEVA